MINFFGVKKYLPLDENQTPAQILKERVWVFLAKKPSTTYIEIKVTVIKHEKLYEHERKRSKKL